MMKFLVLGLTILLGLNSVVAQVFDFVVAKDGSGTHTTIQSAIDACPNSVHKNIFVKAGTYREKVYIGSHSVVSTKHISLIGEDPLKTLIVWDDYNGKSIYYYGSSTASIAGGPQSATFTVNAVDFYAENITFQNEYTAAQAVALYNVADRQTFKNCRLIGFQDTHYLKKGRRSYFLDCFIEGGVDYICAGGTTIFESCTLHSVRNGGYITAPEDIIAYTLVGTKRYYHGFVFKNCKLTSDVGISVFLGRPWQPTSSSVFIDSKMENIKPEGWSVWNGNESTSFFAEYNSKDFSGNLVDVSGRATWSYQLTQSEVENYYTNTLIYSHITTSTYEPVSIVTALAAPVNLSSVDRLLSWDAVASAIGYVICRDGVVIGFSASNSYNDATALKDVDYQYVVKSVKNTGGLSTASEIYNVRFTTTGISGYTSPLLKLIVQSGAILISEPAKIEIFSMTGSLMVQKEIEKSYDTSNLPRGYYLIKATTTNGTNKVAKVIL